MYSRAIEFLEGALTIIPRPTLFGGEVSLLLRWSFNLHFPFHLCFIKFLCLILLCFYVFFFLFSLISYLLTTLLAETQIFLLVFRSKYGLLWLMRQITAMEIALLCTSNWRRRILVSASGARRLNFAIFCKHQKSRYLRRKW